MAFVPTATRAAPAATAACQPKVVRLKRRNAPKHAPCPHCGQRGRRKQVLHRTVRDLA